MPSLEKLTNQFPQVKVYAINMEQPNKLKVRDFFRSINVASLDTYYDPKLKLVKQFKMRGLPTSILIDKNGEEFGRVIGEIDFVSEEFINLIKKSKTPAEAKEKLLSTKWTIKSNIAQYIKLINSSNKTSSSKVSLDEEQAKAILELRLQKLTALERDDILNNLKSLVEDINSYLKILNSDKQLLKVLKNLTKLAGN